MHRFSASLFQPRLHQGFAPNSSPSLVSTWSDETWSRTVPKQAYLQTMHPPPPAIQPRGLSKTVKRRNRRRIRKMYLKIQEASEAALTLDACTSSFAWSTTNAASTKDRGEQNDSNESDDDCDEEARDRAIWNASTFSSSNSPTRTATPELVNQLSASAQHTPASRITCIAPRQPVPCTMQLIAIDIAASVEARELRYVQPDAAQNPAERLRSVLALATRMHAQAWPNSK